MNSLNAITLPDDLRWTDEFSWSPVRQSAEPSLVGTLNIEESALQQGRPITLQGYINRSTLLQLQTLAATPAQTHTLNHNGTTYNVVFRRPVPLAT